jgi:hypothetical protein
MSKPLIQIDDLVREMTDQEYSDYLEATSDAQEFKTIANTDETPSAD